MMEGQRYFEDVDEGMELPPKSWGPIDTVDLVRFCSAVDNYGKLHQDYYWCTQNGFEDVLISGPMKQAFLCSWLDEFAGDGGFLKKISVQHRGMDYADRRLLTAKGKVTSKYEQDGLGFVECDIRMENDQGRTTCPGRATVILPVRGDGPVPVEYETPPQVAELIAQVQGSGR